MHHAQRIALLAAAFGIVLAGAATAADKPADKAAPAPKKILLVTHSGGFIHSSVVEAEKVLKEIGPKAGFEVTCWRFTNDPDAKVKYKVKDKDGKETEVEGTALDAYSYRFQQATKEPVTKEQCGRINADTLKDFDAVFFFTTGDPCGTPEEMKALLDFIKSGKGFLGTHCATDTLYKRTEYGDMIGGYFDGHPWHEKTKIVVDDAKNPIVQGLGDSFEITDELYQQRDPYARDKLHVLLRLDPLWVARKRAAAQEKLEAAQKKKLEEAADLAKAGKIAEADKVTAEVSKMTTGIKRDDDDYAMAWTKTYGQGRVFYTALGHREEVWRDERFQKMLLQAMRWTTREIDPDAAPGNVK
jgi:uncharacterized protein